MANSTKLVVPTALMLGILFLVGCSKGETPVADQPATTPTTTETTQPTEPVEEEVVMEPGTSPWPEYPIVASVDAEEGDYVLAPSRNWVDEAFTEGPDSTTFIYYSATMVEPGEGESTINDIWEDVQMPNSMIIPIPSGQTAEPGDVVLTWWQSGSGMMRAYVVEGGTPEEPMVRYIDLDLDNPATNSDGVPIAEGEEQLEANSFYVLSGEFMPGSAVAVSDGSGGFEHFQVVNVAGDKMMVIGFAGTMKVVDTADAIAIPVYPDVKVGDDVAYPLFGDMRTGGTVTEIDEDTGRIFVEYDWIGTMETVGFAFGDIMAASDL